MSFAQSLASLLIGQILITILATCQETSATSGAAAKLSQTSTNYVPPASGPPLSNQPANNLNTNIEQQQQLQAPQPPSPAYYNTGTQFVSTCNNETEFHCPLENTCLPITWKCDFTEQCLDGRDESHCVPQWCDFGHGFCSWLNDFHDLARQANNNNDFSIDNYKISTSEHQQPVSAKAAVWRHYVSSATRKFLHTTTKSRQHQLQQQQQKQQQRHTSNDIIMAGLLDQLASESDAAGASGNSAEFDGTFAYVPLVLTIDHHGATDGAEQANTGTFTLPINGRKLGARISAPLIGQTASMCRLRFKYAIWVDKTTPTTTTPKTTTTSKSSFSDIQFRATLRLVMAPTNKSKDKNDNDKLGKRKSTSTSSSGGGGLAIWSRTIVSGPSEFRAAAAAATSRRPGCQLGAGRSHCGTNWSLGVAELGHQRQIRLSFEAELLATGSGDANELDRHNPASRQWQDTTAGLAIVALKWLAFDDCNWPQASVPDTTPPSDVGAPVLPIGSDPPGLESLSLSPSATIGWRQDVGRGGGADSAQVSHQSVGRDDDYFAAGHERAPEAEAAASTTFAPPAVQVVDDVAWNYQLFGEQASNNNPAAATPTRSKLLVVPLELGDSDEQNVFKCSNGIDLPTSKLCNYVDDCMSKPATTIANDAAAAADDDKVAPKHSNNPQSDAAASTALSLGEDESDSLCSSLVGRETFEHWPSSSSSIDSNTNNTADQHQEAKFWIINPGNWPIDGIRIADRRRHGPNEFGDRGASNLPLRDHTRGISSLLAFESEFVLDGGKYLSIALPKQPDRGFQSDRSTVNNNRNNNNNKLRRTFWMSLDSPWMEMVDSDAELGECRMKLFFNLVAPESQLILAAPEQLQSRNLSNDNDEQRNKLPFKIYLAIEHFTANTRRRPRDATPAGSWSSETSSRPPPSPTDGGGGVGDGALELERELDGLIHLEENVSFIDDDDDDTFGKTARIELPGVDFWREINFKLIHLNRGDLFFLRISVYLEYSQARITPSTWQNLTINLDDLSTHFGCDLAKPGDLFSNKLMLEATKLWHQYTEQPFDPAHYLSIESATDQQQQQQHEAAAITMQVSVINNRKGKWHYFDRRPLGGSGSGSTNGTIGQLRIEPHKLVVYVLGAVACIIGLISMIVFVVVPYVERVMMDYQEQIQLGLSGEISDMPIGNGATFMGGGSGSGGGGSNNNLGVSPSTSCSIVGGHHHQHHLMTREHLDLHQTARHQVCRSTGSTVTFCVPASEQVSTFDVDKNNKNNNGNSTSQCLVDSDLYLHKVEFSRAQTLASGGGSGCVIDRQHQNHHHHQLDSSSSGAILGATSKV